MEGDAFPRINDAMIGRHFSNVIMHWKVNNISLALCLPKTQVHSPEFTLSGPLTTRWKMILDISSVSRIVLLHLDMLPSTAQDIRVQIHWAAYVMNPNDKLIALVAERKHTFQTNLRMTVDMFQLIDIIKQFPSVLPDELNIRCCMLVNFGYNPPFPLVENHGVMALSYDLSRLPKESLHSDVTIKSNNVEFPMHRGMFHHRSGYLASLMSPEAKKTINVRLLDHNALDALFSYLYTGDLSFVLSNPSIRICDYIRRLGIPELQDVYPLEKLKLESNINAEEYQLEWIIYDYLKITHPISSTELNFKHKESRWQFHVGLGGETIYVEVALLQSTEPLDVCFELHNYNSEGEIMKSGREYGRMTVGNKLGIWLQSPINIDMVQSSREVLFLRLKIRIATGGTVILVKESHPPSPLTISNERTYMNFSNMMGMLQLSEAYSDVTLTVGDDMYKAHRFLLAARSTRLRRLLQRSENQRAGVTLSLPKMKDKIFRVFLDFLYTGILMVTEANVLTALYDISGPYGVPSLKRVCLDKLVSYVHPDTVLRYLAWADYRNEEALKCRAMEFISDVSDNILAHRDWTRFALMKPKLSSFIRRCLRVSHPTNLQQHAIENVQTPNS